MQQQKHELKYHQLLYVDINNNDCHDQNHILQLIGNPQDLKVQFA